MAFHLNLYSIFIVSILFVIPFSESRRCSTNCTFQELPSNPSIPTTFCPSSNQSNDDIDQACRLKLTIDFTRGFANGSFATMLQPPRIRDKLDIITFFSLIGTKITIEIDYICSISDYCDVEFLRETLSPALVAVQMESFRQNLSARLYDSNNVGHFECSDYSFCSKNSSFCYMTYVNPSESFGSDEKVSGSCAHPNATLTVEWYQLYTPYWDSGLTKAGTYLCNKPNCGSNATVLETFHWLAREYILPLNVSILNTTTTPAPTTTTTTVSTTRSITTTTTSNQASILFGHFNIIFPSFAIILFFCQSFFQLFA
jgi:hypothetical protein